MDNQQPSSEEEKVQRLSRVGSRGKRPEVVGIRLILDEDIVCASQKCEGALRAPAWLSEPLSYLMCPLTLSNNELKDGEMKRIDLTGKTFGQLTVIGRAPNMVTGIKRQRSRKAYYCRCSCGCEKVVLGESLTRGNTKSCGCTKAAMVSESRKTHGESKTLLYGIWCAIKRRRYNTHDPAYPLYGGRGITMCDEWKEDYVQFRDWALSHGYVPDGHNCTIDRIDVDGNYCPENCRWVDSVAQANNRRSNHLLTLNGETHNMTEWSQIVGIPMKKIADRIYHGWSVEKALTTA